MGVAFFILIFVYYLNIKVMATYAEIVNNLRNIYSSGISSDDYNIEDEQLLFIFNTYRALFIRRELDKGSAINSNLVQDFCINMECGDYSDCCPGLDTGTRIMKSVQKLPTVIDSKFMSLLMKIGSADGSVSYQIVPETQVRWNYNKYTGKLIKVWIKNNHVLAINMDPAVTTLSVSGVFEHPHFISGAGTCDGGCFSWDETYPIAASMIPIINSEILSKELRIISSTNPDIQNDTNNQRSQG